MNVGLSFRLMHTLRLPALFTCARIEGAGRRTQVALQELLKMIDDEKMQVFGS
jgi:hypothetical protein